MGQKVIYVDPQGTRFPAEITGPIDKIEKNIYENDGGGVPRIKVPGSVTTKIGEQKIQGATEKENRTRPYVNLTVNFGNEIRPRYADVTGVRLKKDNDKNFNKAYYEELAPVAPKAEKSAPPVEVKAKKK